MPDADQTYVNLDGGLAYAAADGWSPGAVGVDIGLVADLPVGTWRYNAGARAIVARDDRGFFAYSALCTHEGCLVSPPGADGVASCRCHNSRFDGEGRPTMGPALTPLQRHAVRVVGARVFVDPSSRVSTTVRADPSGTSDDVPSVDSGVDPCASGVDVGELALFAVGTWTRLTARSLIVGRDAAGLFAYSARCTHQNCLIDAPAAGTGRATCSCHGSQFDGNGHVLTGPARVDLDHYLVAVCAGRVRVDAEQVVAVTARTPVP